MKSGVKAINRQKFLTELGKLLTFMYEEDRQLALSMYERMFDAAEDEQALIQGLMSPTRQAVIIARAYDAKERKLSVSSKRKDEDGYQDESNEIPPFVLAINRTFDELFPDNASLQEIAEDQISLFDEALPEEEPAQKEEEEHASEESGSREDPFAPEDEDEQEEEPQPEFEEEAEDFTVEEPGEEKPQIDLEDTQEFRLNLQPEEETEPEEDRAGETEPQEEPEPKEETPEETDEPKKEAEEDPWEALFPVHTPPETEDAENAEEAAAPAASLASKEPEPAKEELGEEEPPESEREKNQEASWAREPEKQDSAEKEAVPAEQSTAARGVPETKTAKSRVVDEQQKKFNDAFGKKRKKAKKPEKEAEQPEFEGPVKTVAKVPLLILYLIIAIPVTLALVAALLIPTLLCLTGSLGMIAIGTVLIISAFSGFAVMADIMLLLGAAIVALALGLLFLWLFLWFIGGVIGGLIRVVVYLGRKWCYKEVPAE